jgi:hypothetical protein
MAGRGKRRARKSKTQCKPLAAGKVEGSAAHGRAKEAVRVMRSAIRRNAFIIALCVLCVPVFLFYFTPETVTPDGSNYMLLGKQITEGEYGFSFLHRLPFIPSIFAALHTAGFSAAQIGFAVPLFFIMLSLAATYLLSREIAGEKAAVLSAALLFCFPEFWRWGMKFLTDIPVLCLSAFSLYFFLRGLKDRKHFIPMAACISAGLLTKISFAIVPLVILSYAAIFRRGTFAEKKFLSCMIVPLAIFALAFSAVSSARQADDFSIVRSMADASTTSGSHMTAILQLLTGNYGDITYFASMVLFPLLIFLPFGICEALRKKRHFLIFSAAAIFLFFFTFSYVRLRYYSPLYPFITLLASTGFLYLRGTLRGRARDAVSIAFSALLIASFINTLYLSSLDTNMQWGAETLSRTTSSLDGLILSDYLPHYLNLTADVVTNSTISNRFLKEGAYGAADLEGLGVKYVVLSIYGEFSRSPSNDTYHPYFGPFEITFVERPYTGDRVPPGYTFRSGLYRSLEESASFEKTGEIYREGQKVFVIYRVAG